MPCLAPDYCIHPGPWNPFPLLHYSFEASGCQSICLQQQLCWWCRCVSRDGTRLQRRLILQRFFQNAGLLLWRHRGLGGCIWASFGPALQEARRQRRWVQQGCAGAAGTSRSCASSRGEWCPPRWRASHASGRWGCRSWRRRSCARWGRRAAPGGF